MAKLKERLENHIVVAVLGFSMSVGVAVYSIVSYFHAQELKQLSAKHEIDSAEQSARLASIERDMPDQKYFDIRNLIATADDESRVPTGSQFFVGDQFYAIDKSPYWDYAKTTEGGLILLLSGMPLSGELTELGNAIPIHLWKSSEEFYLESEGVRSRWFPFVFVQRLPYRDIPRILNLGVAAQSYEAFPYESNHEKVDLSESSQQIMDSISSLMRDDFTGIMFHMQNMISIQQAIESTNQRYRQLKVQKIGNVLYSQSVTEHLDVIVNGQPADTFYLRQEMILVSTRSDLYIIKFTVPGLEPLPRGKAYAEINSWLAAFRVVMDL